MKLGEVKKYRSLKETVRDGHNIGAVWSCCNKRKKHHHGLRWEYQKNTEEGILNA